MADEAEAEAEAEDEDELAASVEEVTTAWLEEDVTTAATKLDEATEATDTTDDEAKAVELAATTEELATTDELATTEAVATPLTAGIAALSARTQPVFAVNAAGHATCSKSTVGLSEPPNQSKRQLQPA